MKAYLFSVLALAGTLAAHAQRKMDPNVQTVMPYAPWRCVQGTNCYLGALYD